MAAICPMTCRVCHLQDTAFDLALCSHLLFTYSKQLSASFHVEAVLEMCRVARESAFSPLGNERRAVTPRLRRMRGTRRPRFPLVD